MEGNRGELLPTSGLTQVCEAEMEGDADDEKEVPDDDRKEVLEMEGNRREVLPTSGFTQVCDAEVEGDADDEKEVLDEGKLEEVGDFETDEGLGLEQDTEQRNAFLDDRQEGGNFESAYAERAQQMEDAEEEDTEEIALAVEGQNEDGNFGLEEGVKQEDGLVELQQDEDGNFESWEGVKQENGLVKEGQEEDGNFDTEEGVQIFSGSDEFIGEFDGEDRFFQLATDYEYEEEELDDMEQEEKDREYLEGCFNGMVYGESYSVDEEEESTSRQNLEGLHQGRRFVAPAGSIVCCTQDKVDEDYKLDEDYIAPEIVQLGKELVRSDESDGEREEQVDPICRRTRARYSLTDMSLDQLETFLQGSDEEDDFQTMDDREEYEKFLRAVLEKDDESEIPEQSERKEDEEEEEEEEEEDVDFEIEIEEALESDDASESVRRRKRKRPETREKRRQRAQFQSRPLRQLLPHMGNVANDVSNRNMMPETVNVSWPTHGKRRVPPVGEFTAHQIGQLYCLMHEHVQLLVQVHSLCVWDPARLHIAKETHGLLLDLVKEREKVLSWKKTAFKDFCFRPPYTHPSTAEGAQTTSLLHALSPPEPAQTSTSYGQSAALSSNNAIFHPTLCHFPLLPSQAYPFPRNVELFNPSGQELLTSGPPNDRGIRVEWAPIVLGTVHSVLDVAPLALVQGFLTDMGQAVQEYQQTYLHGGAGRFDREPLFAITVSSEQDQSIGRSFIEGTRSRFLGDVELMPGPPQIRRTMAAALVESTKKESISPVPKGVATAVQRFLPYFNKAMFPHKAPPLATSNRLLFTEAEDELLAMGMMEFNHEWNLIQQRYLPCKTEHQVKIRAKNRSSTKALANSIKAVHQFKTSPLTEVEKKAIHEGLGYYKHDWDKIWLYCVPHRDPATLQRQYRTAIGTQKSYKTSETCKERRRLYEASRRQKIAALKASNNPSSVATAEVTPPSPSCSVEETAPPPVVAPSPTIVSAVKQQRKLLAKKRKPKPQPDTQLSSSRPWLDSHTANTISNSRKQTVKLAPDLPFVKLPSHVQVLSQFQVQNQLPFPFAQRAVPVPVTSHWGQRPSQALEHPAFSIPALRLQPLTLPNCAATEPTIPQQGIPTAHHLNVPSKVVVPRSDAPVDFIQMMEGKKSSKMKRIPVKKNKKASSGTSKDTTNEIQGRAPASVSGLKGSHQFRTFLEVGGISDPCTSHNLVRSRNTGRNRSRKNGKQQDLFVEEGSQEPLADQHIVMEQEELSDSEDEPDAGVEFEHEEMGDDSDRETEAEEVEVLTTI